MSRLVQSSCAVALLAVVIVWLLGPCRPPRDLGPGDELVGRPGVARFLVRRGAEWWSFPAHANAPEDGQRLAEPITGRPALAADGTLVALSGERLLRRADVGDVARVAGADDLDVPAHEGPLALVGLDGGGAPVLAESSATGTTLHVRPADAWLRLELDGQPARPADPGSLRLAPAGRALAFRGPTGWEAWDFSSSPPVRRVAEGCTGAEALFDPAGRSLIVEGRTDGLFRLGLADGRLDFMSLGNLGASRRVPWTAVFRGDPLLLLAPQRDLYGFLQLFQTHLTGHGKSGMTTGNEHHYGPAVSHDGRRLAYLQASFDEQGGGEIEESVYILDFDQGRAKQALRRRGGLAGAGPIFVGDGATLVLLAEGRVAVIRPADSSTEPSR